MNCERNKERKKRNKNPMENYQLPFELECFFSVEQCFFLSCFCTCLQAQFIYKSFVVVVGYNLSPEYTCLWHSCLGIYIHIRMMVTVLYLAWFLFKWPKVKRCNRLTCDTSYQVTWLSSNACFKIKQSTTIRKTIGCILLWSCVTVFGFIPWP